MTLEEKGVLVQSPHRERDFLKKWARHCERSEAIQNPFPVEMPHGLLRGVYPGLRAGARNDDEDFYLPICRQIYIFNPSAAWEFNLVFDNLFEPVGQRLIVPSIHHRCGKEAV
jgi:hypothetical protein